MTTDSGETLEVVSEDDLEELNDSTTPKTTSKPKSSKKKKKSPASGNADNAESSKTKSTKKKKSSSTSDDELKDNPSKPKSSIKKKNSISTDSTGISLDEDWTETSPKSTEMSTSELEDVSEQIESLTEPLGSAQSSASGIPPSSLSSAGRGPGRGRGAGEGRGRQASPMYSGRGRGPPNGRGNVRAATRPQSMRMGPSPPSGGPLDTFGKGPTGSSPNAPLNGSNHHYGAPRRPASMVHMTDSGGRGSHSQGGRGRGVGGAGLPGRATSVRGNLNGNLSSHGGLGGRSSHAGRPSSILRTPSSRGRGAGAVIVGSDGVIRVVDTSTRNLNLAKGSNHHLMTASSHKVSNHNRKAPSNRNIDRSNSIDSFDIDNEDVEVDFGEENRTGIKVISAVPGMIEGLSKSFSKSIRSMMDLLGHSGGLRGDGISSHEPSSNRRPTLTTSHSKFNASTRSILTVDMEYADENRCVQLLRYLRIMSPHPDEKPLKKRIRIFTWIALCLDLLIAIVAIIQYSGVTMCCGEPMMDVAGNFPWEQITTATIYLYIVLIMLEVIPVVRDGFPFNLFNPFVGFLITFAVFFNDSVPQAAFMWAIEALVVASEFYICRLRSRVYQERLVRLEKTEAEIKTLRKVKKKIKQQYESGRHLSVSTHSLGSVGSFDSDDSFHDESDNDEKTTKSGGTDISKIRETKLYRERRVLRETNAKDRRHLRYHTIGAAVNFFLVAISLLLIAVIVKNKGLCIVDMEHFSVFKNNQLEMCYSCKGKSGVCEICNPNGTSQCYYPYA